jgi:signal transduction histidine kinase
LIQDLLDLARLEAGSLELELRDHDVRGLLEQSIEMHQPLAAESGQRIVLACEPGCGRVHCDRDRTFQVLANLLGNAIKFSPAGGVIQVHAKRHDGAVEIAVRDEGPGIPREHSDRIFERYFQAQRADGRGVGLGLSIAKGIVDAHGGKIGVENLPDKGGRFWFTLPGVP